MRIYLMCHYIHPEDLSKWAKYFEEFIMGQHSALLIRHAHQNHICICLTLSTHSLNKKN